MAAAAASATGPSAARGHRGFCGSPIAAAVGGGKDGKLDACLFAGALGAGDFLLLVDHDLLKSGLALLAEVFVDGHRGVPLLCSVLYSGVGCDYSRGSVLGAAVGREAPSPLFYKCGF